MNIQRRLTLALKKVLVDDIFYEMTFGKHKGKTVGEVFEIEPSYLVWAHETCGHFSLSDDMYAQALEAKQLAYQKHWLRSSLEHGMTVNAVVEAFVKKFKYQPSDDFIYNAVTGLDQYIPHPTLVEHTHTGITQDGETIGAGGKVWPVSDAVKKAAFGMMYDGIPATPSDDEAKKQADKDNELPDDFPF